MLVEYRNGRTALVVSGIYVVAAVAALVAGYVSADFAHAWRLGTALDTGVRPDVAGLLVLLAGVAGHAWMLWRVVRDPFTLPPSGRPRILALVLYGVAALAVVQVLFDPGPLEFAATLALAVLLLLELRCPAWIKAGLVVALLARFLYFPAAMAQMGFPHSTPLWVAVLVAVALAGNELGVPGWRAFALAGQAKDGRFRRSTRVFGWIYVAALVALMPMTPPVELYDPGLALGALTGVVYSVFLPLWAAGSARDLAQPA
ncbi:hypothetical protein [Nonomuraea sp. NPDC050310]|uniref:hypothetical protein n=1 Tax=Nonomuraea sp. NPDC050310 TaxID=3154935 RepID=UPI0034041D37